MRHRNLLIAISLVLVISMFITGCGNETDTSTEKIEKAIEGAYEDDDLGTFNDMACEDIELDTDPELRDVTCEFTGNARFVCNVALQDGSSYAISGNRQDDELCDIEISQLTPPRS